MDLTTFRSKGDSEAVRFGGLGFSSIPEAGAWMETHASGAGYGWVYDHHTLMQAVHTTFSGEDLIKRLSKGYELEIEERHQAATIAAFETAMPRYFCANPT